MRRVTLAISVCIAAVLVLGACGKSGAKHGQQTSGQQTASAPAAEKEQQSNPLCQVINAGRSDLAALAQRANSESNPLRRNDAEQAYQQRARQFAQDLTTFVSNNEINDYVGTVSVLNLQGYNSGPGMMLGIDLPCNATISFQFVTTNPAWGSPDNRFNVAIERWRPTLESLAVNDTVTFSGVFMLRYGAVPLPSSPSDKINFEGRITDLRKGRRPEPSSATIPPLTSDDAIRIAQQAHALSDSATIQMYEKVDIGEGGQITSWPDYVAKIENLKSALERHGFIVSGFDHSNTYYYSVSGTVEPPPSAQQLIIGRFSTTYKQGYTAIFLQRAETTVLSFNVNGDRATGSYRQKLVGCTVYCELWKDIRAMPPDVGPAVFLNCNPGYDLDAAEDHTVEFSWDPLLGWHVKQ